MRRAATAALCLSLLGCLALLGGGVAGERAEAASCAHWKQHSKRVVKHVEQGGETRRVVKVKRWRTCARRAVAPEAAPVAAPIPIATPPVLAPPTLSPEPEPEGPAIERLGVTSEEFSYTLSRPEIAAGPAIVELNNEGGDPHNLNLEREGGGPLLIVPVADPGKQQQAKFDLPAGKYRMWCSLPTHEELGMKSTLIVGE